MNPPEGFTIRDHFAAVVLGAVAQDAGFWEACGAECDADPAAFAARMAYTVADAMMAQRDELDLSDFGKRGDP